MIGFNHLGRLGRLGNQMFQFAALKGIARNRNFEICIPNHTQSINDGIGNMLKTELFIPFDVKVDSVGLINAPYVNEPHFNFSEEFFNNCPDNVSLVGFFQTEKYFKHIENEIREDFSFKEEIKNSCNKIFNDLCLDKPISLHIRRGDYILNSDRHNVLPLEYYENALSKFNSNREVIIFSDDPSWCKEQKLFSSDRFFVSEGTDEYHDLCLMSMCDGFIIANSSFSWWAAWLSNKEEVYYPSIWFGPAIDNNTDDITPNHWKEIEI
jgi:hypothetical protein